MAMDVAVAAALTAAVNAAPTGSAVQPTSLVLDGVEWKVNNEATLLDHNGPTSYCTWTLNDLDNFINGERECFSPFFLDLC